MARLPNWVARINEAISDGELARLRISAQRGSPFGGSEWAESTARRLGLESSIRPKVRPQVQFSDENQNNES